MPSGPILLGLRDIRERTTTVIEDQRQAATAATLGTSQSSGVGPGSGLRWLVQAIGISVNFSVAPSAGDRGEASAQIVRGGVFHALIGAEVEDNHDVGVVTRGIGCELVMLEGDTFRVFAGALGSSVGVVGVAVLWGYEYFPL